MVSIGLKLKQQAQSGTTPNGQGNKLGLMGARVVANQGHGPVAAQRPNAIQQQRSFVQGSSANYSPVPGSDKVRVPLLSSQVGIKSSGESSAAASGRPGSRKQSDIRNKGV